MSAEPTGRLTRRLWPWTPLVYCPTLQTRTMCGGNCSVHAHTYITHTAQTFSAVQMLPPVSQRMQKGWDRQTAGVGGQLRWTDPVGKPQAGRHTTAAAYLLNVGFERLATLFIETRFQRTNRRCGWRAGDIAREKKCFRISLVIFYNFLIVSESHVKTKTNNEVLPVYPKPDESWSVIETSIVVQ